MTPAQRRLVRQLVATWATVAILEVLLWWVLWRSAYMRTLWTLPASVVFIVGVLATLGALRRRRGDDRRRSEERRE